MIDINSVRPRVSLLAPFKLLAFKMKFKKEHPLYFVPDGLVCFTGSQGSGKSLVATLYVYELMNRYPNAKLVTNLKLKDFPFDNEKVFPFENEDDLKKYNNGEKGVIFYIDEIQLYFNSLQSKNINPEVMTQLAQQRKQRKHIIATSQVFGRMAKPLREQFSSVVVCRKYLGFIQVCKLVNKDDIEDNDNSTSLKGKVSKKWWFFHHPKYFDLYDTYYVIEKNKFVSNEQKKGDIYDNRLSSDS